MFSRDLGPAPTQCIRPTRQTQPPPPACAAPLEAACAAPLAAAGPGPWPSEDLSEAAAGPCPLRDSPLVRTIPAPGRANRVRSWPQELGCRPEATQSGVLGFRRPSPAWAAVRAWSRRRRPQAL
ncbi:hypothetical protein PAHAL_8G063700 [Panicum hallii]|uniref:Uncharacterized protein n=1 Tax=Panicum hallii TaxID=206008 RepID=A0A2T8I7Y4_9POAL|nr:hypothetical protein PAHAL_8G063700 [Panicum hallii]